jgi:hypothetical protein
MTYHHSQRSVTGGHAGGGSVVGLPQPAPQSPGGVGPIPIGQPVSPVDWFRRMPGGGTVFVKPADTVPED